jgi:transitional endoplasmic reticulum ATPase
MDAAWLEKTKRALASGRNVVVLHHNTRDRFVYNGQTVSAKEMLLASLAKDRWISYALNRFTFDSVETELVFRKINGLEVTPEDPGPWPGRTDEDGHPDLQTDEDMAEYQIWSAKKENAAEFAKTRHIAALLQRKITDFLEPIPLVPESLAGTMLQQFVSYKSPLDPEDKLVKDFPVIDPRDYVVFINDAHYIAPDGSASNKTVFQKTLVLDLADLASDRDIPAVIIFAPELLSTDRDIFGRMSNATTIEVPAPTYEDRQTFLHTVSKEMGLRYSRKLISEIAWVSSGLTNHDILNMINESITENEPLSVNSVRSEKNDLLTTELAGLVEMVNPIHGFECIGGLEVVKKELNTIADDVINGRDWIVPMGILLTGPPGTGKTVLAEALAKTIGFNFIKLGNVKSKWVGESERNIARIFEVAKELSPVIIFVDEIDQEGQRGNEGDSGVSNHIFAAILRTMSDTDLRGKIMWIAATNRPDMMDAAMKRPGRFDIKIPLLYPTKSERMEIFQAMSRKYGISYAKDVDIARLGSLTHNYNGADIEAICLAAARLAYREGSGKTISDKHFFDAVQDYVPHHDRDAIQKMTKMALQESSSISLVPEKYQAALKKIREDSVGGPTESQDEPTTEKFKFKTLEDDE